jgi:hypothetical protein
LDNNLPAIAILAALGMLVNCGYPKTDPKRLEMMCKHCGHPIGYHWLEDEKCTVKDCRCPGYKRARDEHEPLPPPE